jgi:hypothetical protein
VWRENHSVSQLIREATDLILPPQKTLTEEEFKNDPFFKIIGMCESGIKDGSLNHDKSRLLFITCSFFLFKIV